MCVLTRSVFIKLSKVTYLFRTTGQVLGVSLSGAILQAVLLQKLRMRIQDPRSAEVGFSANHIPIETSEQTIAADYLRNPVSLSYIEASSRLSLPPFSHSAESIRDLDPQWKKAAVDSYADALRAVFIFQAAMAFLAFLTCLPIEENPLP